MSISLDVVPGYEQGLTATERKILEAYRGGHTILLNAEFNLPAGRAFYGQPSSILRPTEGLMVANCIITTERNPNGTTTLPPTGDFPGGTIHPL